METALLHRANSAAHQAPRPLRVGSDFETVAVREADRHVVHSDSFDALDRHAERRWRERLTRWIWLCAQRLAGIPPPDRVTGQ